MRPSWPPSFKTALLVITIVALFPLFLLIPSVRRGLHIPPVATTLSPTTNPTQTTNPKSSQVPSPSPSLPHQSNLSTSQQPPPPTKTQTPHPTSIPNTSQPPILTTASLPTPTQTRGAYTTYSGPASNFPDPGQWASYDVLWAIYSPLWAEFETLEEIGMVANAIQTVSKESGVDARVILCIIQNESSGEIKVADTTSGGGVTNTGLMQAHNGVSYDSGDPQGSILQMIRDGTEGTWGQIKGGGGDGLVQCYAHQKNWYAAAREYNSGSVDPSNLSDGLGATANYVEKFANRIMGHAWAGM